MFSDADVEVKRKPSAEGESFSLEVHKFATKQPTIDKKTDSSSKNCNKNFVATILIYCEVHSAYKCYF